PTGINTCHDDTAPYNIMISGWLRNGAVLSSHVVAVPFAGSGYRMEIYGREGTLVASGEDSPQLSAVVLRGAKGNDTLKPMPVPERFTFASSETPAGEAGNVGQMYTLFAKSIRDGAIRGAGGGAARVPDFATAVELHRLVDATKQASDEGREVR